MRKLSLPIILVLLALLSTAMPASAAKSYYAERFDVQIDIQVDGSAIVTETVEFHFSGDPFTFAFREISATETDGLTFFDASMDGVTMQPGNGAGQVEVEAGNPLKVTWHFAPTSDAAHVFTVRYLAEGVIRKGDADTLIWRAVPEEHDYSISHSTITLTYPPHVTPLTGPTLDWDHDARFEENRVVLTANGLGEDEDLILTAAFPQDSLTQVTPQWQVAQEQARTATAKALPIALGSGIATLLLGGLGLLLYGRAEARELTISSIVPAATPPSDISPALVGKLTKQPLAFMGAIFDLAQRGALEVRGDKGVLGTTTPVLTRKAHGLELKPFEQGLLDALFKPGETEVKMNEVSTRLGMKSKLFEEPLERELIRRGWLDTERIQKRSRLLAAGFLIFFLSLILLFFGVAGFAMLISADAAWLTILAALTGISAGAFILSIAILTYATTYSIRTPAGEEQAAQWTGFGEYLRQVSKGREPAIQPDYFERYLAFAAMFGLGAAWAKYFQTLGGVPLPLWFRTAAEGDMSFASIIAIMAASDSSGSVAGAGGAAGASGGGSSGAG